MAWYSFPLVKGGTHADGDDGDDVSTPNNTPLTMPFAGVVEDASYYDYGGQVVVDVPGTGYSEYTIHMNDIYVQPGEQITPQTVVGTSGGGVGDKVLHNGRVQPAQAQSWFDGHSGGYHTEYGIFEGENMAAFNEGWGNHSRQLDPTGVLAELAAGQSPKWPGNGPPPESTATGNPLSGTPLGDPITGAGAIISNWIGSRFGGSVGNAVERFAVGGVGVALVLIGVAAALHGDQAVATYIEGVKQRAGEVAKMAEVAA